ncbi:chitotriosidase-1 [Trichonephila clavipes]|nr:chitotriosidase-1 [Trichonephila clavipes]
MGLKTVCLLLLVVALAVYGQSRDRNQKKYKVVCYLGSWANYRGGDGKFLIEHIDPFLCTHVIYGFAKLAGNKIAVYDPYLDLKENWGLVLRTIVAQTETTLISKQNVTPLVRCPVFVFCTQLYAMPPKWVLLMITIYDLIAYEPGNLKMSLENEFVSVCSFFKWDMPAEPKICDPYE